MKLAFLLSSLHLSGGVRAVIEYTNRLAARGHHCSLVIPANSRDPEMAGEVDDAVEIVECALGLPSTKIVTPYHILLVGALAAATPKSDIVISTHTPTTVANLVAGRILRKGKLVWLYMDYPGMFEGRPVESWLLHNALRWHHLALTISENETQTLRRISKQANPNQKQGIQVETVSMGLSHQALWRPTPSETRPVQGDKTLLYVGDARPRKGLQDFLEAAALIYAQRQDIRLQIVCKDDCPVETAVPHERIHRPSNETLAELYATCTVFVSTSWWEGLGMPPLEAMASATPVVMTDSGGSADYARDEENCLLVPIQDPAAVAAAVLRLLEDPALAARLSANGPATAAQFGWQDVTVRFEQLLQQLLEDEEPHGSQ